MADLETDLASLNLQLSDLEGTIQGVQEVSTVFRTELSDMEGSMRSASRDALNLSRTIGSSLGNAFQDLVFDGAKLSDVLGKVGKSVAGSLLNKALQPIEGALGGVLGSGVNALFGGLFANGAAFSAGRVTAFANGGVVNGPTGFPMRGGMGLMGEAGPEAIMPLTRGADGKLGVRSSGGGRPVQVTVNVQTPDVAGFRRSKSQIAAQMNRALRSGGRNL